MIIVGTMLCKKCKIEKSEDSFYKQSSRCKSCAIEYQSAKRREMRYDLKKYGLSKEDYEAMLNRQEFKCAICAEPHLDIPEKKWGRAKLSVDHNHKTGKVRDLLCHRCNSMLGLIDEREELLRQAIAYLHRWEDRL
jgi:recombination endonuclease VII